MTKEEKNLQKEVETQSEKIKEKTTEQLELEKYKSDSKNFIKELQPLFDKYNLIIQPIITELGPNIKLIRPISGEKVKKPDIIK